MLYAKRSALSNLIRRAATFENVGCQFKIKLSVIDYDKDLCSETISQGAVALARHTFQHDEVAGQAIKGGIQVKSRCGAEFAVVGKFARLIDVIHQGIDPSNQIGGDCMKGAYFLIQ